MLKNYLDQRYTNGMLWEVMYSAWQELTLMKFKFCRFTLFPKDPFFYTYLFIVRAQGRTHVSLRIVTMRQNLRKTATQKYTKQRS